MKTQTKHTPGPWEVNIGYGINIQYKDKVTIRALPETEANARLIAAAPELLAQLKIEHGFESCAYRPCYVCTLIAKAEGKS